MKKHLFMAGRILFAAPFLVFGAFHLMAAKDMAGLVPGFFPGSGELWVYLTGLAFIGASIALLAKKWMKEAALLIAFQLAVFIVTVWLPQLGAEGQQGQMAMMNLLKDTALLGGALTYAAKGAFHGKRGECCGCGKGDCSHCAGCESCKDCKNCGDCSNCRTEGSAQK